MEEQNKDEVIKEVCAQSQHGHITAARISTATQALQHGEKYICIFHHFIENI